MMLPTADLYDKHAEDLRVLDPIFRDFGGVRSFYGPASTVRVHEDNSLVRAALEEPGNGRLLVIDGGGSTRCALVGDQLARLGADNGWAGIVVFGCVRDTDVLAQIQIGIKALAPNPRKSVKRGDGHRDVEVAIAGEVVRPGDYVYADADGIVVADFLVS
jgi:regulator of ribonuclease activity A